VSGLPGREFHTASIVFLAENAPRRPTRFLRGFFDVRATPHYVGCGDRRVLTIAEGRKDARDGWRAAFVSGIVVSVVGVIIRLGMFDSPARAAVACSSDRGFRDNRWQVLRVLV